VKALAQLALTIGIASAALYLLVLAWLWFKQESLLFFPEPLPAAHRLAKEPDVHEVTVGVPGAQLSVLHLKLPNPRGVVFFLHGNAGNLEGWFTRTDWYRRANYDLVMPDYRGYGKSTGRIESETQLRADVAAVWSHFAPAYEGKSIVIYGRSLGSGLAAGLAAQLSDAGRPPALTMLVSPYSSIRALTREIYPWVPPALLRYPLDTEALIGRIQGGLVLVHGERDELIRLPHAQRLHARVPHARLHVIAGGAHNDLQEQADYERMLQRELGR
jgi:pimeloyl-ACP methyl ester carboxylesterase